MIVNNMRTQIERDWNARWYSSRFSNSISTKPCNHAVKSIKVNNNLLLVKRDIPTINYLENEILIRSSILADLFIDFSLNQYRKTGIVISNNVVIYDEDIKRAFYHLLDEVPNILESLRVFPEMLPFHEIRVSFIDLNGEHLEWFWKDGKTKLIKLNG